MLGSAAGKAIEIWFQDEARVGQQGSLEYIWAPVGSRPLAVRDNRHDSVYLFGALCPSRATGAAIIMPAANSEAMSEHLKEIAVQVAAGAHAVLVTSAAKAAYDAAVPCVRPTGILLVVGLPADSLCFSPISMAGTEIRIQASAVGTRQDLREVLDMAAAGKVRCQVTSRPLADANAVLEDLRHGRIAGRVVLTPG